MSVIGQKPEKFAAFLMKFDCARCFAKLALLGYDWANLFLWRWKHDGNITDTLKIVQITIQISYGNTDTRKQTHIKIIYFITSCFRVSVVTVDKTIKKQIKFMYLYRDRCVSVKMCRVNFFSSFYLIWKLLILSLLLLLSLLFCII